MDFVDCTVLFEQILKIVLGGLKREITYVHFHCVLKFGKATELQSRSRESGFKPPMSNAHLTIYRAVKLNSVIQYPHKLAPDSQERKSLFPALNPTVARDRGRRVGTCDRQITKCDSARDRLPERRHGR